MDEDKKRRLWEQAEQQRQYQQFQQFQQFQQQAMYENQNRNRQNYRKKSGRLATWKLVSGILSIILFVITELSSCFIMTVNTIGINNAGNQYVYGIIAGCLLLSAGIVSIVMRYRETIGSDIATGILYVLSSFLYALGYTSVVYISLCAWGIICSVLAVISMSLKGTCDTADGRKYAITSMILGIFSLVCFGITFLGHGTMVMVTEFLCGSCAVLGLGFSHLAKKSGHDGGMQYVGFATSMTAVIFLGLSLGAVLLMFILMAVASATF